MTSDIVFSSLAGGALVGIAAAAMLLFSGRIAGNSGIIAGLLTLHKDKAYWKLFYVLGLFLGALLYQWYKGGNVEIAIDASYPVLVIAGLLVGYGTRLGGGCTSGHGICGIARFSKRSIAATVIFLVTGMATVFVIKHIWGF